MERYSCFQINDYQFGIELNYIQEIIQIPKVTKLPNTFSYIKGIFSLRGEFLPLFDIGIVIGVDSTEITIDSKCLIVKDHVFRYGILVTGLLNILEIEENEIKKDPTGIPPNAKRFVEGFIQKSGNKIFIIDVPRLSISEELTVYL